MGRSRPRRNRVLGRHWQGPEWGSRAATTAGRRKRCRGEGERSWALVVVARTSPSEVKWELSKLKSTMRWLVHCRRRGLEEKLGPAFAEDTWVGLADCGPPLFSQAGLISAEVSMAEPDCEPMHGLARTQGQVQGQAADQSRPAQLVGQVEDLSAASW